MSVTIFCTFEQQDLADLAAGRLRATTAGIKSIYYLAGYGGHPDALRSNPKTVSNAAVFPVIQATNDTPAPSRPVTLKIVCTDASCNTIISRLVNMHAYQIITTG